MVSSGITDENVYIHTFPHLHPWWTSQVVMSLDIWLWMRLGTWVKSPYHPCSKRKINNLLKVLHEYHFSPLPNHSAAWLSLWSGFWIHSIYTDPVYCDRCGPFSSFQMPLSFRFEPHGSRSFLTLEYSVSFGRTRAVWEAHGTGHNRLQVFVWW